MENVGLFPPTINSSAISVDSFRVVAISATRYDVIVEYSFVYEQSGSEILQNFLIWLSRGRAPDDLIEVPVVVFRLPVGRRSGTIEQELELETISETIFNVYFQV